MRITWGLALAVLSAACAARPHLLKPAPARSWPAVRDSAQLAAQAGRFEDADRALAEFARRYAASAEGREGLYWRALLRLDPAYPGGAAAAVSAFDAYLASGGELPRRAEAVTLRRLAARLDALGSARGRSAANAAAEQPDAAREEEMKKLKLELKSTQEELERIKRRLTAPKP